MSTKRRLHILILEDNPIDADLLSDTLAQAGFEFESVRVETETDFINQLSENPDLILADYTLPQFNALKALQLLQALGLDIPFIVVTGTVSEEVAVACIKQGAADYLLKDRLARLGQAVVKALADKGLREERRKAEEELRRLKEFNENIVQSMAEGVVILDADGVITFVNPAVAAIVGYTLEESVGLDLLRIKHFIPADQHAFFDAGAERRKRGQVLRYEIDVLNKDGTRRSLLISSSPRFEEGHFAGTLAVLTDITERKRAENELRKLYTAVEQSGSSVVITDLQRNIEYVNPRFTAVTGYTANEAIGKNVDLLKSSETLSQVYKQLWDTILAGGEWRGEFHNRKKSGELFWESASISAIKDAEGRVTNFLEVKEDITERKRDEQELRESEERYRTVADYTYDWEYWRAPNGRILYISPSCEHISGYRAEEFIEKPDLLETIVHPDDRHLFEQHKSLAVRQDDESGLHAVDLRIVRRDGEVRWIGHTCQIIHRSDGTSLGQRATNRDITDRKRAEQILVAERNLLRTLIDNLPDNIYAKDAEGRFTLKNQADARQMGAASTDEVIGKTDFDYYPPELAKQYDADDQAVIQFGQPVLNREEPVIAADGSQGWMVTSKVPLRDDDGNVIGLVGIGRDITARKRAEDTLRKSEEQFRLLFEEAPAGIALIRNGVGLYINRALLYMFGYEDQSEMAGGQFFEQIAPPHYDRIFERLGNSAETLPIMLESLGERKDGSQFPISMEIGLIELTDGLAHVAFVNDLSEHKRLEEETLKAERLRVELEKEKELTELKERFTSMVSHEFRTPLTVIRMSSELMANYPTRFTEERKLKFLQENLAQVKYMVELLDDVLTVGKAKAGKTEFNPMLLDVEAFCQNIFEQLQLADGGTHQFIFINENRLGNVYLDEHLVRHILVNLLSNAAKYSPGGGDVRFQLCSEGEHIVFRISDQGIGIPAADQERLFETFHRAKNAAKIQGTGLGLAIVKASVERHGGTITFDSQEGVGTTFTVRLPTTSNSAARQ